MTEQGEMRAAKHRNKRRQGEPINKVRKWIQKIMWNFSVRITESRNGRKQMHKGINVL